MSSRSASPRASRTSSSSPGRGKNAIEDHFDSSPELERFLEIKGKTDQAEMVRSISNMVHFSYTRQKEPLGLGHAVLDGARTGGRRAVRRAAGRRHHPRTASGHAPAIEVYEETGIGAIAVENSAAREDPPVRNHRRAAGRGIQMGQELAARSRPGGKTEARGSALESGGHRAICSAAGDLRLPGAHSPGRGGEIQLTDALRLLAQEHGLYALIYEGQSYDAGDKLGFLKATVELALENREFGEDFRQLPARPEALMALRLLLLFRIACFSLFSAADFVSRFRFTPWLRSCSRLLLSALIRRFCFRLCSDELPPSRFPHPPRPPRP